MPAVLCLLLAYLLGSVSGALVLGRWQGVDIRTLGSGNAGGTNALRTRGWRFALGVVLIDVGKGVLAGLLARALGDAGPAWLAPACVLAAVAGHVWPLFHGFRGGKGAATLIGGLAAVWPAALLPFLGTWLVTLGVTGFVGLSTVLGALSLPIFTLLSPWPVPQAALPFALLAASFLLFTHRSNLARLRAGTEHRFERARLLARRRR